MFYLLTRDQIYAMLFAISDLSTEVIEDQQLTPTSLQKRHLVLHLKEAQTRPVCHKLNVAAIGLQQAAKS